MPRHTFFVTCAPGVEPFLLEEARRLRLPRAEPQTGGLRFEGTLEDAWLANLHLRTAVRVLLRLSRFAAPDADALYRGVAAVDWSRYLRPDGVLWVDAQVRESALDHSRFVAQRVKDAIVDRLRTTGGVRPSVDREGADLRVHLHLYRDRATLSLDTSGESLHKRGWRRAQGRAPLAETLAAAVVLASQWDRRAPLLDPFCGSGTILVEAGLYASETPPGAFRSFGFERWPGHDAAAWARAREEALARRALPQKLRILGQDHDAERVAAARANVATAGLDGLVEVEIGDARRFAPRRGWNAWIVTNPPYGERVGDERALEPLYREFGARLREHCAGYRLALLSGNPRLTRALDLPEGGGRLRRVALRNGAIACELLLGEITA